MVFLRKNREWLLLVGIMLSAVWVSYGQFEDDYFKEPFQKKKFDESKWREIAEGMDYQPNEPRERKNRDFDPDWQVFPEWLLPFVQYSLIILVCGLLAFLIFKMLYKNLYGEGKIPKTDLDLEMLDDLEQNIHQVDLDGLLAKALEEERFQLAIRLYYLLIVRKLSNIGFIHWKKSKTNASYVAEMLDKKGYEAFSALTRSYEKIWYGNQVLSKERFKELSPSFESFYQQLAAHSEPTKEEVAA